MYGSFYAIILVHKTKKAKQNYLLLTRNAKHWKKVKFYTFAFKILMKIFFKKLKLPSTSL